MWWSIGGGIIIFALGMFIFLKPGLISVSYTHLDVYKRQDKKAGW